MPADPPQPLRPAEFCRALLSALDSAEGRRRSRKRDQTPDAIGLAIKRDLLRRAIDESPPPERFEEWLLNCSSARGAPELRGAAAAMARSVFDEWSLAQSLPEFRRWLDGGAPSDDAAGTGSPPRSR